MRVNGGGEPQGLKLSNICFRYSKTRETAISQYGETCEVRQKNSSFPIFRLEICFAVCYHQEWGGGFHAARFRGYTDER